MKIERINDKQFRCTLDVDDLTARGMNLRELAYGSAKTKKLLSEMVRLANAQIGFTADDSPLMMEAIPLPTEGIMLIVTKVDDPEELDARFSQFSPASEEPDMPELSVDPLDGVEGLIPTDGQNPAMEIHAEGLSDEAKDRFMDMIFNLIQSAPDEILNPEENESPAKSVAGEKATEKGPAKKKSMPRETVKKASVKKEETKKSIQKKQDGALVPSMRLFAFPDLDSVITAARASDAAYQGESTLLKDSSDGTYYLILRSLSKNSPTFVRCCNRMSEYAKRVPTKTGTEAFIFEHYDVIIAENALQKLSSIG